jgi:hypothetical protein
MFTIHPPHYLPVSHYLPLSPNLYRVPEFDLPSPRQALTDTFGQLPSPGSTPEPYAEQEGVALAAEMGNPVAVDIITNHYRRTGLYGTSN